ncbi:TetR/AcrR family transcriptional regulator, partial [Verrucomicrobiales bacterium]|nr:TetR/AcrR family transcriptional regulator [Verrucomicrobiales bacterium]
MGTLSSKQKETREQILDTAEVLFAADGFRNVSLRRITTEADVNIAAVNYHFGSKEALVSEVLSRVISPINGERLRLLNAAEEKADGSPLTIETLLDCMIRPVVNQIQQ